MDNLHPLVTVLMAVYNGDKYLREAIDSILTQTYTNFEFLIINDGSTDNTENIILSYSDERIRYIKNETNLKLIASLNKGLDLAKGKYIARMDADDISLPERLETQVNFLINHPQHIFIASKVQSVENHNKAYSQALDYNTIAFKLISNNCIYHSTVMFNAELLGKFRYHKDYLHVEDYELWTRCANIGKIEIIQNSLVKYRVHDESISQSNYSFQYKQVKIIRHKLISNFIPNINSTEFEFYNKFLNKSTNDYFKANDDHWIYDSKSIAILSNIISKVEKNKNGNFCMVNNKDFANYLRELLFQDTISHQMLERKYCFNYFSSSSFKWNLFSKKIILKWLLHIQ